MIKLPVHKAYLFSILFFLVHLPHYVQSGQFDNDTLNNKILILLDELDSREYQNDDFFDDKTKAVFQDAINRGNAKDKGLANYLYGKYYMTLGDFDEAVAHLTLASEKLKNSEYYAEVLLSLGKGLSLNIKPGLALEAFYQSLEQFKSSGNDSGRIKVLIALGEYYRKYKKFEEADSILSVAEEMLLTTSGNPKIKYGLYSRISAVSSEIGKHNQAMNYSIKALNIAKSLGNPSMIATSINEIAYLEEKNNDPKSIMDYNRAAYLRKTCNEKRGLASVYSNIVRWYFNNGRHHTSMAYLDSMSALCDSNNWPVIESEIYFYRFHNYQKLGDFEKALEYQEKYYEMMLSDIRKDNQKAIAEVKNKYDLKEKEWQIKEQEQKLIEEWKMLKSRNRQRMAFLITAIVLLLLSAIMVYLYIRLKREQGELRLSNKQLNRLIQQKQLLVREMHHRIKNNLNILSSLVHIQQFNQKDELVKEQLAELQSRIDTISSVHQQMTHVESNPSIKIDEFFNNFIDEIASSITSSNIFIIKNLECAGKELSTKRAIPLALIINELVTNSIKHGFNGQPSFEIGLTISIENDILIVKVCDTGPGILNPDTIHAPETMGMELVTLLVDQLNAELAYEKGEKSEFTISFKL